MSLHLSSCTSQLALHYDLPLSADSYSSRARHETHAIYLVPYGPTGRHAMKSLGALSRMKIRTVACPSLSLSPSAVSVPVPASLLVPHSTARFADVLPLSMPMRFTSHAIDMDRDCPAHATPNRLLTSSACTAVHGILDRDEHGDVYGNGDGERDRDRNRDGDVEGEGDGVAMVIEEKPLGTLISIFLTQLDIAICADVIFFNVQKMGPVGRTYVFIQSVRAVTSLSRKERTWGRKRGKRGGRRKTRKRRTCSRYLSKQCQTL